MDRRDRGIRRLGDSVWNGRGFGGSEDDHDDANHRCGPTTTVAAIEETTTTKVEVATTTTEAAATVSDAQAATLAAYETTWNDGDEDAFRVLFASQAVLLEEPEHLTTRSGDVDFIVGQGVGRRAMGIVLSIDDCAPSDDAVVCTAEFDGPVPTALNFSAWRDRYVFSSKMDRSHTSK